MGLITHVVDKTQEFANLFPVCISPHFPTKFEHSGKINLSVKHFPTTKFSLNATFLNPGRIVRPPVGSGTRLLEPEPSVIRTDGRCSTPELRADTPLFCLTRLSYFLRWTDCLHAQLHSNSDMCNATLPQPNQHRTHCPMSIEQRSAGYLSERVEWWASPYVWLQ